MELPVQPSAPASNQPWEILTVDQLDVPAVTLDRQYGGGMTATPNRATFQQFE